MKEVSTRAFGSIFRYMRKRGVAVEDIVVGSSVTPADLRNRKNRIDWADFLIVMSNLSKHFSDEEYIEIGRSYFRAPTLRFAFVVARTLFSPMEFYRWLNSPKKGVGNQMFTCVVPTHRELSESELEVDLILPDEYPVCWEFFVITIGNFEEMPRLLGAPPARVSLTRLPNGGRFHIVVPQRTPLLTKIRRAVTWPFTAAATARELKDAHETLLERYHELEHARSTLDAQAKQLRTAHSISSVVQRELDLDGAMDAAVGAMVTQAGLPYAEIEIEDDGERLSAKTGSPEGRELVQPLTVQGGQSLGTLKVTLGAAAGDDERETLVSFVAPMISMAIHNAVSYRSLKKYQSNLERLVDERTADLRSARDDLAGLVVQLREVQGSRDAFFANISHEIRTPLSLVVLAAGDVEQRLAAALDERSRANLTSITSGARKLLRLVDELLLLAAGEETKLRLRREVVDVGQLVSNLITTWRPAAETAGLSLEHIGPPSLRAFVDEVAIDRIITNLVSNAVKFTPRGGKVVVTLEDRHDELTVRVRDTGAGIAADLSKRLFGRFERGANNTKGGSGIGLSLVKQLSESHGGSVDVAQPEGGGAEFVVKIPRRLAEAPAPTAASSEVRHLGPADFGVPVEAGVGTEPVRPSGASHGTVLVAEDDPALLAAVVRLLSDDYTVIGAPDGKTALELAKRHQPHLLVTDVQMPGMTGIELAERFRAHAQDRLAPVVIMSAIGDLGTRVRGFEAGAIDYVVKPFDPKELRARVRAQFRMRELALRLHHAEQLSALGTLSAGLAHELRNPANGIINAIHPIRRLLPPELTSMQHPVGQLLDVAAGCADQIAFLSRQLLNFRSKGELELRPATVSELVKKSLTLAHGGMSGVDVRMALEFEGAIHCAPQLMIQVLTNLFDNAAQAANGGWVEVASRANERTVSIEVCDSGKGVPTELRERVFEPFFTTKPPGVGTGLGLPLARDIVHRHGGTLEIRDRGQHCVFAIDLPRHAAQ